MILLFSLLILILFIYLIINLFFCLFIFYLLIYLFIYSHHFQLQGTYATTTIHYLQYNIYSTYLQCAILTLLTILYSTCNTTLTILTYNVRYATNIAIPALLFTYIKNIQLPKNYIYPLHERRGDA